MQKVIELTSIMKNGDTWMANFSGNDYLCLKPSVLPDDALAIQIHAQFSQLHTDIWKPLSEISWSDDLAKLRPKVVWEDKEAVLYGCVYDCLILLVNNEEQEEWSAELVFPEEVRLATFKEVQIYGDSP